MRIIDLAVKIANGKELPKKIKVEDLIYEYRGDDYVYVDKKGMQYWLFGETYNVRFYYLESFLNAEVEIIEEVPKKIKKCDVNINTMLPNGANSENDVYMMTCIQMLGKDLNALIDCINRKEYNDNN